MARWAPLRRGSALRARIRCDRRPGERTTVRAACVRRTLEADALEAAEWPLVCAQVAAFASTPMGADRCRARGLDAATSVGEATTLCDQTDIAIGVLGGARGAGRPASLASVGDVGPWLDGIAQGRELDVRETDLVVSLIEGALEACEILDDLCEGTHAFDALQSRRVAVSDAVAAVCATVREAVIPGLLYLDARASPELSAIRADMKAAESELNALLRAASIELHRIGAAESPQVVIRRDRFCVPVRRGQQGQVEGGVTLDESKTGQTVYMEPGAAVQPNNVLVACRSREREEEKRLLRLLSSKLRAKDAAIRQVFDTVADIDLVFARARHARWLGGSRPTLVAAGEEKTSPVDLREVLHPVLLQPHLEPLPGDGAADGIAGGEGGEAPKPIDVVVPEAARVVTISGPNTGGKTAALKVSRRAHSAMLQRCHSQHIRRAAHRRILTHPLLSLSLYLSFAFSLCLSLSVSVVVPLFFLSSLFLSDSIHCQY